MASVARAVFGLAIRRVRLLKILWAMGDEPEPVPVLGLPLMRYRALVFVTSGVLAGLAGGLIVPTWEGSNPQLQLEALSVLF